MKAVAYGIGQQLNISMLQCTGSGLQLKVSILQLAARFSSTESPGL